MEGILEKQFDFEIHLKHQEIRAIKQEIEKAENALSKLSFLILNDQPSITSATATPEPKRSRRSTNMVGFTDLVTRKDDGSFVRVACPSCNKSNFANMQGFVNHCRISHQLEFDSHNDAISKCGLVIEESTVPASHPARSIRINQSLAKKTRDYIELAKKAKINEFDEQVDIESGNLQLMQMRRSVATSAVTTDASLVTFSERPLHTSMTTGASAPVVDTLPDIKPFEPVGSRFYVSKKIIIGNYSRYLKAKADSKFQFKWAFYVKSMDQDISEFITKVRFYLHPDYKPFDVVELTKPPFEIWKYGWGEFPLRIQLFFVDPMRNKPLDIIQQLKLDISHSGKLVLGNERLYTVNMDRNTGHLQPTSEINSEIDAILDQVAIDFPLITKRQDLPFKTATCVTEFLSWDKETRKAELNKRALAVQEKASLLNSSISQIPVQTIEKWLLDSGYTPIEGNSVGKTLLIRNLLAKLKPEHSLSPMNTKNTKVIANLLRQVSVVAANDNVHSILAALIQWFALQLVTQTVQCQGSEITVEGIAKAIESSDKFNFLY